MKAERHLVRPRSRIRTLLRLLVWGVLIAAMVVVGVASGLSYTVYDASQTLPGFDDIRKRPNGTTLRYFSMEGRLIHSKGPEYGEWLEYEEIPLPMRRAIIAVEDRRYREHHGVDPIALARAVKFAWESRGTGRRLQGASTVTQQVARTLFLTRDYDARRKIDEMTVALALEQRFSKNQILEIYLNRVYFGGNAYGIDAAARTFFGHSARDLTTPEAALLAGMVKAPSDYSPTADPAAARGRMRVVLGLMRETGQDPAADIAAEMPKLSIDRTGPARNESRHFIDWVAPQVEQIRPDLTGQVDIHTTLSLDLQDEAKKAVETGTSDGLQAALTTLDERGAVRAMIGGRDYASSTYNRATSSIRQPGSSFKLFVYLSAIEAGFGPNSQVYDGPITIGDWSPKNNSGRFSGNLPMRTAFSYSLNTVAARFGQKLGTRRIAAMAQRLGITTPVNVEPSMVLGSSDVRLIDMTQAYATVASGGLLAQPFGIERIERNGAVVYRHEDGRRPAMISRDTAATMTSLMRGTVEGGTGLAAQIGRPAAGKTGTTNSNKDGWFIGFSSGLTTGVWVGRDDARPVPGLQGGRTPARIFSSYMRQAVQGRKAGFEIVQEPRGSYRSMGSGIPSPSSVGGATPPSAQEAPGATPVEPAQPAPTPPQVQPQPRGDGRSRAIRPEE